MASRKKDKLPVTVGDHAREIVKLKKKYENWGTSKEKPKFIELCYKLGKNYEYLNNRKEALPFLQLMVDNAKIINHKLSFEQLILYSEMLVKPDPKWEPTLAKFIEGHKPSKEDFKGSLISKRS